MTYLSLLVFLALVAAAAITGSQFMPGDWYMALKKPDWTPPGWLFGPVWTVLYIMIAVAGWLVWRKEGFSLILTLWLVQLIANMAWSWIMFGTHQIGWALLDITLLWLCIAGFIALAWTAHTTAALLFVPYLLWVSFATALNFSIWRLNGAAT